MDKLIHQIHWHITYPASYANFGYDGDENPIPVPDEVMNHKLPIRKYARVALVYCDKNQLLLIQSLDTLY